MGASSSIRRPQKLSEFRKLNTAENVEIPARPENRTRTDKKGFFLFGLGFFLWVPFLVYSLTKSDLRHFTSGVDECGNFCGHQNSKIEGLDCSGVDYTTKPYEYQGKCVATCSYGLQLVGGRCLRPSKNNFDIAALSYDLQASGKVWWKYLLSILVATGLSTVTLLGMRFLPGAIIKGIIYLSIVLFLLMTVLIWSAYTKTNSYAVLVAAIIWTIFATILLIILIALFKKLGLVVQLYKEAAKTLEAMPSLVLLPIPMLLVQIIVVVVFAITTILTLSAREFQQTFWGGSYAKSGIVVFATLITLFLYGWSVRFVSGIYYMTVSSSVGEWFFSRNKNCLGSPISTGFINTVKYHLGTVTFGSFLLTLFSALKSIMQFFVQNNCSSCFACCSCAEILFNFVSENSYIETALHGQSYIRSAKRATRLLLQNAKSVIAVTCIGDFVLGVIMVTVAILASGVSYALFKDVGVLPFLICLILNLVIVLLTLSTFLIIIRTLFICFCEDSVLNDGVSKPYYMSRGLMEFVERSKKDGRRFN